MHFSKETTANDVRYPFHNKPWKSEFFIAAFLCFVICWHSSGTTSNCEKKEKSLVSLEIAAELIEKAKANIPNCNGTVTNASECGAKDKASAYLDMAKNMISEVKTKFPTCTGNETNVPSIKEAATVRPSSTTPVTEKPIPRSRDCSEVFQNGQNASGVYTVWLNSSSLTTGRPLRVFCDMQTQGGGWTVIQRRGNFTPQENFYRDWVDYKNGFGSIAKDFWLGNDNLFAMTSQFNYSLRFDLEDASGNKAYALYKSFWIEDEASKYKLHIDGYSGNAGNALEKSNNRYFSTRDKDELAFAVFECNVLQSQGAWWDRDCFSANPNGLYQPGVDKITSDYWYNWKTNQVGLAAIEMKLIRK